MIENEGEAKSIGKLLVSDYKMVNGDKDIPIYCMMSENAPKQFVKVEDLKRIDLKMTIDEVDQKIMIFE